MVVNEGTKAGSSRKQTYASIWCHGWWQVTMATYQICPPFLGSKWSIRQISCSYSTCDLPLLRVRSIHRAMTHSERILEDFTVEPCEVQSCGPREGLTTSSFTCSRIEVFSQTRFWYDRQRVHFNLLCKLVVPAHMEFTAFIPQSFHSMKYYLPYWNHKIVTVFLDAPLIQAILRRVRICLFYMHCNTWQSEQNNASLVFMYAIFHGT